MKISNLVKELGSFEPDGYPFLSIYLNAEPSETGRDTFQVWLKTAFSDKKTGI